MTDDDLKGLVHLLRTIPAVHDHMQPPIESLVPLVRANEPAASRPMPHRLVQLIGKFQPRLVLSPRRQAAQHGAPSQRAAPLSRREFRSKFSYLRSASGMAPVDEAAPFLHQDVAGGGGEALHHLGLPRGYDAGQLPRLTLSIAGRWRSEPKSET